jgi:hypothetical protein
VTTLKRIFTLPILCLCLAAAGCGGDEDEGDPIPSEQADALLQQLEVVENRLNNGSVGACRDVFTHAESPNQPTVDQILTQVPRGVDPEVRSALEESFARLWDLVDQECDDREADEPAQPEPDPEPVPQETEEEPTETAPPEEEEPPPEEEDTLPPEGDGDNEGEVPPVDGGVDGGGGVGPGGAEVE